MSEYATDPLLLTIQEQATLLKERDTEIARLKALVYVDDRPLLEEFHKTQSRLRNVQRTLKATMEIGRVREREYQHFMNAKDNEIDDLLVKIKRLEKDDR